ncbi:LAQU0S20e01266g1_1 [Lachancea quebecensis]|uniref:LAQU0S20e01266g1_1 n=1 Tax=Lachancea quebecensis TaxID=1654605 RepID=A0A0P1L3D3_9SACH|nr:LAQU0S20e01266g1_1 [Lachancea quebecensis]
MVLDPQLGAFASKEETENCHWFDISSYRSSCEGHGDEEKWFKEGVELHSQLPMFCGEIKISLKKDKFKGLIGVHSEELKSFAPLVKLHEHFDIGPPADPESLDDSDLELLAGQVNAQVSKKATPQGISRYSKKLLVVSRNAMKFVESRDAYACPFEIISCELVRHPDFLDDVLILLTEDGTLYTVAFDTDSRPYVLQWWHSMDILDTPRVLNVHPCFGEFVVATDYSLQFFKFTSNFHFELVSNLAFENSIITGCTFLYNGYRPDHLMMLLALSLSDRITLCVAQWGSVNEEKKEIHPLSLLKSDRITSIICLGDSRSLIFTSKEIGLVTANQIISGELPISCLQRSRLGDGVRKCFDDPELLLRLKSVRQDLSEFVHCTVFATSNGALCCCLIDEKDTTKFLTLTRFKGLCNAFQAPKCCSSVTFYTVIISSFGRLFEILLDLTTVEELVKDYKIPALQNIVSRRTLYAGHIEGDSLLYVAPSQSHLTKRDRLLLLSEATVSRLTLGELNLSCSKLLALRTFKTLSKLCIIDCDTLAEKWKERFLDQDDPTDVLRFLMIEKNPAGVSRLILLEWDSDLKASKSVELDDALRDDKSDTVLFFFTDENMIQVTAQTISVDDLEEDGRYEYHTSWPLTNALNNSKMLVAWNSETGKILFCPDVDSASSKCFYEIECPMEGETSMITAVSFVRTSSLEVWITVICDGTVFYYDCSTIPCGTGPVKKFTGCGILFGSSCLHKSLFCGLDGEIYHCSHNSSIKDWHLSKVKIENEHKRPLEFRFVSTELCLIFAPQQMLLFNLSEQVFTNISLVDRRKNSTILDVQCIKGLYFVLLNDGLEILEADCFTNTPTNIVVKATRIKGKKYFYLKKINRMLITNLAKKCLDCAKLENGKLMSLDSKCMADFGTIFDIVTLPGDSRAILLVIAGTMLASESGCALKLIEISPSPGKLIVRELNCKAMEADGLENVRMRATATNQFWISCGKAITLFQIGLDGFGFVRKTETLPHDICCFDATDDLLVAVTNCNELYSECRILDGGWRALNTAKIYGAKGNLKINIINHMCVAVYGDITDEKGALASQISFFRVRDSRLECYNTITFKKSIRDVQYSQRNNELCVLQDDGIIRLFQSVGKQHIISGVIGKSENAYSSRTSSQFGCWRISATELSPVTR